MTLSRNKLFLLLFLLVTGPFLFYKLQWIYHAGSATGIASFTGHSINGNFIDDYPVIKFQLNGISYYFNGNIAIPFEHGSAVPVLYQINDPKNARINLFWSIWGDTIVYVLMPVLVLFVLYVLRGKHAVIPSTAIVSISKSKWIEIKLPPE